jgi:hypothetical protein
MGDLQLDFVLVKALTQLEASSERRHHGGATRDALLHRAASLLPSRFARETPHPAQITHALKRTRERHWVEARADA